MKILITGVHGFVGSNLVEYLSPENTIFGLDIISPEKEGVAKTYSWDDLLQGKIPPVDAIIHLAGKAHDLKNRSLDEEYFNINRGLTVKAFDYFRYHPAIKKFIFFSTAKAAADRVPDVLTEDVIPSPVGPYGESKIAAESYIRGTMKDDPAAFEDRGVYIFRPCMIHGPGNKGNLNLLYGVVSKGIPWPLGAFENKRTFTSVENICFAVNGVLTKDVPSGIYNMADDEALSTNELINAICESIGKKPHIWKLPKGLMEFAAKIGGLLHLPLDPVRLQKLTENYIASNAKIKAALGIDKMPVRAKDGLKRTLDSFR
ncbi:MAG: NAD-dependent epimerase/dehydratase family protein [Bacteroidales bacterium]|nr:NAD-dependent epimerase/dehydratase family protein [Bacteroidales bacterium]